MSVLLSKPPSGEVPKPLWCVVVQNSLLPVGIFLGFSTDRGELGGSVCGVGGTARARGWVGNGAEITQVWPLPSPPTLRAWSSTFLQIKKMDFWGFCFFFLAKGILVQINLMNSEWRGKVLSWMKTPTPTPPEEQ